VSFPGRPRHWSSAGAVPPVLDDIGRSRGNRDHGNLVEVTPSGAQIAVRQLDRTGGPPPGAGALFGLAVRPGPGRGVYYVDDNTNTLDLLHQRPGVSFRLSPGGCAPGLRPFSASLAGR
jgi:hypothetical protein